MRALLPEKILSRRRFVGYGAASLATASTVARAQNIAPPGPGSLADDPARIAAQNDAWKHLTIPVAIAGQGPFHFVVDTGADRSVISDELARRLGLLHESEVTVQGVVRSVTTQMVTVPEIAFGTIRMRNMRMPVLPHADMNADGYLGLDAVDGSRVTLDFQQQSLLIDRSHHQSVFVINRPSEAKIPVRGSMGHLRSLNCRTDGVATTCFLDTGAEISVGNSRLFAELVREDSSHRVIGALPITGITGGAIVGRVVEIGRINLHAVSFTHCIVAIADMQIFDIWGLGDQPALLIGMNFLRQFAKVSIDYGLKEIRFDLASMVVARRG